MTAWKPGDLARIGEFTALRRHLNDGWQHKDGSVMTDSQSAGYDKAFQPRPLVVLDPEDREQSYRVGIAFQKAFDDMPYESASGEAEFRTASQAALRSLLAPPKPDEPTGLGAVVEDDEGRQWLRSDRKTAGSIWMCADADLDLPYANVNVVRVLSEGVQS